MRGHVAVCVLAAVIEAVMAIDLGARRSPIWISATNSSRRVRALRELKHLRMICFVDSNGDDRHVVTRPNPLQATVLTAFGVDTSTWRSRIA